MPVKNAEFGYNLAAENALSDVSSSPFYFQIKPPANWASLKLRELWSYRELVYFLVWRDIKVRYKQTVLGAAWAILQPLFTMLVFSIFFGKLAKVPSDGTPYPIFSYCGLIPWMFFSSGLNFSTNSVVISANLVKKIYFPRLAIPLATVLSVLPDFFLSFSVLLAMMAWYKTVPSLNLVWLPLFVLLALVTSMGAGLWLAALNVKYRDIRYIVPFLTQFWLFATPIAYPSSLLKEPWHTVYGLNPMVGVVEGFRWALLGTRTPPGPMVWASAAAALLLLVSGAYYFRKTESTFADIV